MVHLTIKDLSFAYPESTRATLDDVNLEIEFGSYVCLCGRSGCGKTTLLRHLKTVLTPHGQRTGEILFNGEPLLELGNEAQSSLIGYVMQNPEAQLVTDKVWHELAFGLENLGVPQETMRLRVAEMASFFGIQQWFDKDVSELSGGQKQLLNLASVMAMQPSVLVLDEPTSQLDPIATSDFLNTVHKINVELGTTIIIAEHRLEDIFSKADKVVVMDEGRIATSGSPREVCAQLYASSHEMTFALPAPARIYYGVAGLDVSQRDEGVSVDREDEAKRCPLTVREGRTWLTGQVLAHPPKCTSLPDQPLDARASECVIELDDLWFRYSRDGADVLRGLTLKVPQGELFAIVGANGCGKSTTLKCICGAKRPYRGVVRVLGRKLKDWSQRELFDNGIAMLPQDPVNLFAKKTVRLDLEEMLDGKHLDKEERNARVAEVASMCDIEHLLDSHPFDLSGGEQQRAALAKVLLIQPRVLLLDEPTKGIDNFFKQELARIFKKLKDSGVTIVMVSHDIEFCARYADSVSMLFRGEVITTSTPRSFFSQNSFYTTAANRMSRNVFANAVTDEDVIELCSTMTGEIS